jgi:solute carrier family 25 carnitine/acylcarnitine transporter 20/29
VLEENDKLPSPMVRIDKRLLLFSTLKRSAATVVEYPFECIKNRYQALPSTSLLQVAHSSYKCYGIRGFYDGFTPNLAKKFPVLFFRWSMILELPSYYKELLKTKANGYILDLYANNLAALTIASLETPLAAPFDTCKLDFIINRKSNYSLFNYLKDNNKLKQHVKGIRAFYLKEIFGWSSFLTVTNIGRKYIKDNGNDPVHFKQLISLSLLCGITNAVTVTPWDVVRNHLQRYKEKEYTSLKPVIKEIYTKFGGRGFFAGCSIRATQLTIATAASIPIMEAYEKERVGKSNHNAY